MVLKKWSSVRRSAFSKVQPQQRGLLSNSSDGSDMSTVFGVQGPKDVTVLSYPTRSQDRGVPTAAAARPSIDSDLAVEHEKADQFDMNATPAKKTWAAAHAARMISMRDMQRSSRRMNSSGDISARFSQPLGSEGEGSVFPVGLPLDKRRSLEVDIIQRFDRLDINTHVGEFWFLLDASWMSRWVDFVMGKANPPGPISNYNLYDQKNSASAARRASMLVKHAADARSRSSVMANRPDLRIKQGLQKLKDYRAVHPVIWYIFREIYTTDDAPDICRWKADLYSDEVNATRKLRVEQATHTKAVYELRRFCDKIKEEMSRGGGASRNANSTPRANVGAEAR